MRRTPLALSAAIVALPIRDWARALAWYGEVLGCRVARVDTSIGEVAELRFGLQRFSLWLDWGDPAIPLADPQRVRTTTLFLVVPSLARARRTLAARGATLLRSPTGLPFLRDPDGNELFLQAAPRRRPGVAELRRATAYLLAAEAHRRALAAAMAREGIEGFRSAAEARAFERRHGLRAPRRLGGGARASSSATVGACSACAPRSCSCSPVPAAS